MCFEDFGHSEKELEKHMEEEHKMDLGLLGTQLDSLLEELTKDEKTHYR